MAFMAAGSLFHFSAHGTGFTVSLGLPRTMDSAMGGSYLVIVWLLVLVITTILSIPLDLGGLLAGFSFHLFAHSLSVPSEKLIEKTPPCILFRVLRISLSLSLITLLPSLLLCLLCPSFVVVPKRLIKIPCKCPLLKILRASLPLTWELSSLVLAFFLSLALCSKKSCIGSSFFRLPNKSSSSTYSISVSWRGFLFLPKHSPSSPSLSPSEPQT